MSEFDKSKLRRLDIGLLLVFLGLIRHRKAARVATELGLTNSSISHALARLRDVFEDPLFLRLPHGLEPTAVALELEPAIRNAVETLDGLLSQTEDFDPASVQATIRVAAQDNEIVSVIAPLVVELRSEAPGIRLSVRALARDDALQSLQDHRIDLAFGFYPNLGSEPGPFLCETLFCDDYRLVAPKDHPILAASDTLKAYLEADHVLVSQDGSLDGIVDQVLKERGLSRRVVVSVPYFLAALSVVKDSGLIATLPTTLAQANADAFGLVCLQPPLEIRKFDVQAARHVRDERNAMLVWLLDRLKKMQCDVVKKV